MNDPASSMTPKHVQSPDFTVPPVGKLRFERLGFMLDISRNRVPTLTWTKTLIDALAALGYNELQLYMEHTFAYSAHLDVWEKASPMTAADIRELDAYCAARGIELVPNQNSFGHMERWLRHPSYRKYAECPDGFEHPISGWRNFGSTLFPDEKSVEFVDELYSELLPNFRAGMLHVGGDEPWELGKGRSAERVKAEGKHRVYLDFIRKIFHLAEKHGRAPQFWADIILERPDLVPELPNSALPVIWGYEADSPFPGHCAAVTNAGFRNRFYVAPGAGNWNSFGGRLDVAHRNIARAAREGAAHGAKGLLLTAWGDNGHHQPWPTLFPALIMASRAAHGADSLDADLAATIDRLFYPNQAPGNGEALCALGGIDSLLPQPAPPNSFLHTAFFASSEKLDALLQLTDRVSLEATATALKAIPTDEVDPEILLGIDLNRFALERCLDRASHRNTREALKERFAQLWRLRSREGGLAESLAAFD